MSSLNYFKVEIRPFVYAGSHGGEEKLYEITAEADGRRYTMTQTSLPPSYMSELDYLSKLTHELKEEIANDDKPRTSKTQL